MFLKKAIINCIFISFFVLVLNLSKDILIPINSIIPLNIQFIITLFIGIILHARYGCLIILLYFLLGLVEFPSCSFNEQEFGFYMGDMGGFRLGLVPLVILIGIRSDRNKRCRQLVFKQCLFSQILFFLIGTFVFYTVNCSLYSLHEIITIGIVPFIPLVIANAFIIAVCHQHKLDIFRRIFDNGY